MAPAVAGPALAGGVDRAGDRLLESAHRSRAWYLERLGLAAFVDQLFAVRRGLRRGDRSDRAGAGDPAADLCHRGNPRGHRLAAADARAGGAHRLRPARRASRRQPDGQRHQCPLGGAGVRRGAAAVAAAVAGSGPWPGDPADADRLAEPARLPLRCADDACRSRRDAHALAAPRWFDAAVGVGCAALAYIPLVNLFAPAFCGLAFVHYLLAALERHRAESGWVVVGSTPQKRP